MRKSIHNGYLLAVLLTIQAFSWMDGIALGLVSQNIKSDLSLSDTQLGVLSGIAFALFYSVMGIPIARWADRGNRITIITITTAVWSVMVALCGVATSFGQLLFIRIGVAVGQAGCFPPAHSLIADNFSRAKRPRAVAIYMLGGPLSALIGYLVSGWVNEFYGWRATFITLGLSGLVPAAVVWLTLRDPHREKRRPEVPMRAERALSDVQEAQPPQKFREVCAVLWRSITFRHLLICFSVGSFFSYGLGQWQAMFLLRSFGVSTGELGTSMALIAGGGGLLGTYLGGEVATRYAAHRESLQLKSMGIVYVSFGVICAVMLLSPNYYLALGLLGLACVGVASIAGPLFATIQTLVPQQMRATSVAILYLFANLIGMGFGPLAVGWLSDVLAPWVGAESLRYALLTVCPGFLWCAWHLWRASQSVTRDLEESRTRPEALWG